MRSQRPDMQDKLRENLYLFYHQKHKDQHYDNAEQKPHNMQKIPKLGLPTINPLLPSAVEVHLINKDIDLYGLNLSVEPVEKLRSQIQFKNIDQLSNQIKKDRDNALRIFKNKK